MLEDLRGCRDARGFIERGCASNHGKKRQV